MKLKLEQLHLFKQVADSNSFTAAATILGISKVAVSKQIAQLELILKVPLFERTTRKLALTPQGEMLYQHSVAVLQQVQNLEDAFSALQSTPSGNVRIMVTPHFAEYFLLPHLPEFLSTYPEVKIEILLEERFPHLEKENIDIFMGSSMPGYDNLVRKQIAQTRYVLCASPQYLERYGTPHTPKDLIKHRYLTHTMRRPSDVIHFSKGEDLKVSPILSLNDTKALLQCAINHMGIVKLHDYVVQEMLCQKKLIALLPSYHEETIPIYLFYTYRKFLPNTMRVLLDFIEAKMHCQDKMRQ
ncbi:LysR family transcriptional regulator [Candidatus Berkiella cookevillensis]|uniref:HTH-type transcriptional regulator DmlR n=1 Tax=Candidatus Berkiella cookevillensis TaxID=437022 RepID=A0A0Q9YPE6_9GAMM|nr:LysR family transcriptional regulator [Candidatus Berkiella cookevillensis]MCS5708738.1 LysR family transcriptional regulator [Candidatus Berkiella cookevillensis]